MDTNTLFFIIFFLGLVQSIERKKLHLFSIFSLENMIKLYLLFTIQCVFIK